MVGVPGSSRMCSSVSSDTENDIDADKVDDFFPQKQELELQGVDPQKGWGFRGVHKVPVSFFCLKLYINMSLCV